jgi:phage terminase small subunit
MTSSTLTPLQERFVREYLRDSNATAAYRRAGYTAGKSSHDAWRALRKPLVRAAIEKAQGAALREISVDAERVVRRLAAIAFANMGAIVVVAPDGTLDTGRGGIDPEQLAGLDTLEVTERPLPARYGGGRIRRIRIRMADKLKALDALSRHLGLFDAVCQAAVEPAGGVPQDEPDSPPPSVSPSAPRRARFVAEYLRCNDTMIAFARAGYSTSARGASSYAFALRADPAIDAAIAAGRRRLAGRFEISAARVRGEYTRIAFANMTHYLDVEDDGSERIDLQHVLPEHWGALRELVVEQHIERTDGRAPFIRFARLKLASKQHALDALAQQLRLFPNRSRDTPSPGLTSGR